MFSVLSVFALILGETVRTTFKWPSGLTLYDFNIMWQTTASGGGTSLNAKPAKIV
jgi:hypothetical protein